MEGRKKTIRTLARSKTAMKFIISEKSAMTFKSFRGMFILRGETNVIENDTSLTSCQTLKRPQSIGGEAKRLFKQPKKNSFQLKCNEFH